MCDLDIYALCMLLELFILFYFILLYFILFYFILFCFILFYFKQKPVHKDQTDEEDQNDYVIN